MTTPVFDTDLAVGELTVTGAITLSASDFATLLAACSMTPQYPTDRLHDYWACLLAAHPAIARTAWADSWAACDPHDRTALTVIAAEHPDLDPDPAK